MTIGDVKMLASIVDDYRLLVTKPRRMTYIETLTSARDRWIPVGRLSAQYSLLIAHRSLARSPARSSAQLSFYYKTYYLFASITSLLSLVSLSAL